ncbi:SIMPL domain-containing protein [candidate division WOR-3 bacterium]|nr:SIMPL domain-containing protein [candidate division WOR-3 bacterium]
MKRVAKLMLVMTIVLSFFCLAFAADQSEPRLIIVTGDAEVRVVPDEVILTLGVQTWNKDLSIAKTENDQRIQKIVDVGKKYKIEEKHIQTDYISIEPRYEDRWEHRKFIGYFVRKTIVFTLRDTDIFEGLLSSVLEAGANYVHGIQFRTTELRKHRDQARALAIKAAQEKANDLAKELGQKVGKPYKIQENQSGWWSWYNTRWGSGRAGGMAQNVIQNVADPSQSESSIALGQIKVNARVTVSFELE